MTPEADAGAWRRDVRSVISGAGRPRAWRFDHDGCARRRASGTGGRGCDSRRSSFLCAGTFRRIGGCICASGSCIF